VTVVGWRGVENVDIIGVETAVNISVSCMCSWQSSDISTTPYGCEFVSPSFIKLEALLQIYDNLLFASLLIKPHHFLTSLSPSLTPPPLPPSSISSLGLISCLEQAHPGLARAIHVHAHAPLSAADLPGLRPLARAVPRLLRVLPQHRPVYEDGETHTSQSQPIHTR
jgi:hypothetical protein